MLWVNEGKNDFSEKSSWRPESIYAQWNALWKSGQLLFSYTSCFTFYSEVKYVQIIYLFKISTFLTKMYFGTLKDLYIYEKTNS